MKDKANCQAENKLKNKQEIPTIKNLHSAHQEKVWENWKEGWKKTNEKLIQKRIILQELKDMMVLVSISLQNYSLAD